MNKEVSYDIWGTSIYDFEGNKKKKKRRPIDDDKEETEDWIAA